MAHCIPTGMHIGASRMLNSWEESGEWKPWPVEIDGLPIKNGDFL